MRGWACNDVARPRVNQVRGRDRVKVGFNTYIAVLHCLYLVVVPDRVQHGRHVWEHVCEGLEERDYDHDAEEARLRLGDARLGPVRMRAQRAKHMARVS